MTSPSVTSRHYTAIFIIALATIALQILFSRILSVTFYYHFAFVGITLAMLGLTAGALKVYMQTERFSPLHTNTILADYGSRFSVSFIAATLLHIYVPGLFQRSDGSLLMQAMMLLPLLLSFVFLLIAFIQSGVCIALLLTRFPTYTGRLYAFDLCGAALGCIAVILLLKLVDPISTLFLLALAVTLVVWRLLPSTAARSLRLRVQVLVTLLALLTVVQTASYWQGTPIFRLLWAKHHSYVEQPLFERWNTYSRIAVTNWKSDPFGWGFGRPQPQAIEQKHLNIDASAGTVLTSFDGDVRKIGYLKEDMINLGYHVRDVDSVAIIGVGGGRDVLSALAFGAKRIQGIEINPAIFEALTETFANFTGRLHTQPGVSFANAEARSWLVSHSDRYDLIQISLIDTWATTAAGGLTLSENKLYTVEAWNDFLDRLNDNGMLVISRWYRPDSHPGEFYRMAAIASKVITARDPHANPRQHILMANVGSIVTMILSKSPISSQDMARFDETCRTLRFTPLLTPDMAKDKTAEIIASGKADAQFFDSLPLNVTASTDDKPFFFNMVRFSHFFSGDGAGGNENFQNNLAIFTLFGLFLFTFVAAAVFIFPPLVSIYRTHHIQPREVAPHMLYFACIGLGFMLVEISQMQRLMVFLGHPVYGLSVVLFTLLLSSSLGSYTRRNVRAEDREIWQSPALLLAVLVATGLLTPILTEYLKYYGTAARVIASGLLIFPMGFFMGMLFPIGVALAKIRHEALLPWYWGINGAASVFSSVAAVIFSLQWGISAAFWAGALCYALCLPAAFNMRIRGGKANVV